MTGYVSPPSSMVLSLDTAERVRDAAPDQTSRNTTGANSRRTPGSISIPSSYRAPLLVCREKDADREGQGLRQRPTLSDSGVAYRARAANRPSVLVSSMGIPNVSVKV